MPSRDQTKHFLNNELKKRAQARGLYVLPGQASINMAEVAKVKIKNATLRRP